jgi:hypothetical protein
MLLSDDSSINSVPVSDDTYNNVASDASNDVIKNDAKSDVKIEELTGVTTSTKVQDEKQETKVNVDEGADVENANDVTTSTMMDGATEKTDSLEKVESEPRKKNR